MEWKFNKTEIEHILQNNYRLTSQDKLFLNNYLKGIYDYPQISTYSFGSNMTYEEAKEYVINSSIDLFKRYSMRYLNFIVRLYEDNIFNINCSNDNSLIDIDEIIRIMLLNYEQLMPSLSINLNKYIYNKNSHIELMDNDIESYQHTPKEEDSFILFNPKDGNGVLSYYMQEAVEDMIPISYTFEDPNLGPEVLRLLFHDRLFEEDGIKYSTDYKELIDTLNNFIKEIYPFILFSKELKIRNYEINDIEFNSLYSTYFDTKVETFKTKKLFSKLNWLTSCLQAIEIRCISKNTRDIVGVLLSNIDFVCTDSKMELYKNYVEEINNRCIK
jgi:hypothetical protein